jgi:hypothetical protein
MRLKALQFSAIMLYALVMGIFWGTWFAQSRTMDQLGPATFMENGRLYIANLAMPMRFLMPGSILVTFLTAFALWGQRGRQDRRPWAFRGTLAAGVLMVAALIITLTVNVPIDNLIKTWTLETLPTDWAGIRDHWEAFHCLRTWVSIAGFSALVAGTLASLGGSTGSREGMSASDK